MKKWKLINPQLKNLIKERQIKQHIHIKHAQGTNKYKNGN